MNKIQVQSYVKSVHTYLGTGVLLPEQSPVQDAYPYVVLLHGRGEGRGQWLNCPRLEKWAEEYRTALILVQGNQSCFADLKTGEQWGNYVRRELPEQLEKWFPVQKDIRGRAILGMDTGGYGAFAAAPWYGLAAAVDPLTDLGQLYDTEYCPDPSSLFGARNELRQNGYELDSGFIQPKLEFTSSLMPGSSVEERMETAIYTFLQRGGGKTWC